MNIITPGHIGLVQEPQELVAHAPTTVKDGWVQVNLLDMLHASPHLYDVIQQLDDTYDQWARAYKDEFFNGIVRYTPGVMVHNCSAMRDVMTPDEQMRLARKTTISGVLFGFAVPNALFLLDAAAVDHILRYLCLTRTHNVNIDQMTKWQPYEHIADLPSQIRQASSNHSFMGDLFGHARPPSLQFVHRYYQAGSAFSENAVRKILTCIYLNAGLAIPRDYLYVDLDVFDYLKRQGQYEVAQPAKEPLKS